MLLVPSTRRYLERMVLSDTGRACAFALISACVVIPLSFQPFWRDEGSTFIDVNQLNVAQVLQSMRNYELTPPLYFLIEHFWVRFAGTSEIAMRVPSIVALSLAVALLYVTARTARDRVAGYATAACAILAPLALFVGSEARAYAVTLLFGTVVLRLVAAVLVERTTSPIVVGALAVGTAAFCWTHYTAWTAVMGLILATPIVALTGDARRASVLFVALVAGAATCLPLVGTFAHAAAGIPVQFDPVGSSLFDRIESRLVWFSPLLAIAPAFASFLAVGTLVWAYRRSRRPPRWSRLAPEDQFLVACLTMLAFGVGSSAVRSVAAGHHLVAYAPAAWLILGNYYGRLTTWLGPANRVRSLSVSRKISALGLVALIILTIANFPIAYAYEFAPRSGAFALVRELKHLGGRDVTLIAMPDTLSPALYYYLRDDPHIRLRGIATWSEPWYMTNTWSDPKLESHFLAMIDKEAADGRRVAFAVDWKAENLNGTRYETGLDIVRTESTRRGVAISRTFHGTVESAELVLLTPHLNPHERATPKRMARAASQER